VGVFSIFATLSSIDFKEMGVGLALAVLIDATIVRAVLLPATMKLLGDWNWYLPSWLNWLPRVAAEGELPPATAATGPEPLRLRVEPRGERSVVVAEGELDLETVPAFRRSLSEAEAQGATVVVDLRGVTFLDSTAIGELVRGHRRARAAGRRFVVVRGRDTRIAQVLHTSAVDRELETVDGPEDDL